MPVLHLFRKTWEKVSKMNQNILSGKYKAG